MAKYSPYKMKGHSLPGPNQRQSPAKQVTREQRLTDSSQSAPADATPRELYKKHKTTKKSQKAPEKQASPAKHSMDKRGFKHGDKYHSETVADSGGTGGGKSPNKWVQFIPMALSALSSMKKDKKE